MCQSDQEQDPNYKLIPQVEVLTWPRSTAEMSHDLRDLLAEHHGFPLTGRIEDIHYEFDAEYGIPTDTVVVPEDSHTEDPGPLYLKL